MTYRELDFMADGHEEAAWEKAVFHGAMVMKAAGAKGGNPLDMIPERYRIEKGGPALTEEEEEARTHAAFMSFETALASWYHSDDVQAVKNAAEG